MLLIAAFVYGISSGSSAVSLKDIFIAFSDKNNPESLSVLQIFRLVRLPRVLSCIFAGAALAVSGAVIQNVLANRLASPGIIGVNSGAGLAVTLCCAFGIFSGFYLSLFSFLGALIAVVTVSAACKKWGASRGTVILVGAAVNSFLGAVSDTVITFNPDISVMRYDFKVGDFSGANMKLLTSPAIIIALTLAVLFTMTKELDILTLGEETAKNLGMNTSIMRSVFLILSALLAGSAISFAGLLSFIGLIIPHTVRRLGATSSHHLLPLCALFGAGFTATCDTLARTVFAPYEIPVGIITSFIGAPFFIFILIKGKGGHSND